MSEHVWIRAANSALARYCMKCGVHEIDGDRCPCIPLDKRDDAMANLQREGQECDASEWVPDARTVRACIDALPLASGDFDEMAEHYSERAQAALEALLPKPKSLAEQWMDKSDWPDMGVQIAVEEFERWLIAEGKLKP